MGRWRQFGRTVILIAVLICGLACVYPTHPQLGGGLVAPKAMAQTAPKPTPSTPPEAASSSADGRQSKAAPVVLDGKTLFTIQAASPTMSAAQRAQVASQEVARIATDNSVLLETLVAEPRQDIIAIVEVQPDGNRHFITAVTAADAEAAKQPLNAVAETWRKAMAAGIRNYRNTHSLMRFSVSLAATAAATLLLVIAIQIINKVAQFICRYLSTRWQPMAQPVQMQNLVILTARAQAILLQNAVALLRWILILMGVLLYSFIITFFFPQTESVGTKILAFLVSQLTTSLQAVVNFIPSLLLILVALVVARFLLRATRLVFDAVETGRITWPGFYPDWARPTRNLVSLLVIAATLAIIFPYLPGSTSPAIQGLGLLAGALLTVGGAGTVASLISGYVIIFARPFQVGDLIAFEDYKGFVHQKSVLATQLRSLNGEILTVPNSALQSKTIVNYSAIVRDLKQPLALTTTLTIGYDVPWREVHQVLIEAASATPKVLAEPSPYVLQTSLDDFYVSYMLKMFIDEPENTPHIYSNLLQNLQDYCAAAGIEIMSPHYGALRDGNQTTIPAHHLPDNYQRPGFQIDVSERSAQSRL